MGIELTGLFSPQERANGVIVVASGNAHKVREIGEILADGFPGMKFVSLKAIEGFEMPEEDGTTFEQNAFIKAEAVHAFTGLPAIADDSGLMVDALDGAPGVYSARYAGEHGDDAANNALLLANMQDVPDPERTARFVSCVAFVSNNVRTCGLGFCEGTVGHDERGEYGFGYDPLFWPADTPGKTMAQITPEEKNAISHRKHALENLLEELEKVAK